ncbi:MAG: hypothetical protein ABIZ05_05745 [Pseudonocardiaceae bacterium]
MFALPEPPGWVVRPFPEVLECYRVADRMLDGFGDDRMDGAFQVFVWLTIGEVSPMTERSWRAATWEVARAESWVALCVAAGKPAPTAGDWERLGVTPHAAVTENREFAYGVWRALAWLLGVRDDWPVHTSWQVAAGMPREQPHLCVRARDRDTEAWRAADQASRDLAAVDAVRHWEHIRARVDATAGG